MKRELVPMGCYLLLVLVRSRESGRRDLISMVTTVIDGNVQICLQVKS
jgi:hypothetical protein